MKTNTAGMRQSDEQASQRARPSELLPLFLRIGAFTFGGGMAMIPLIREEVVTRRRYITDDSFLESLSLAQCAPGPIAGNLAVLIGYKLAGFAGAALSLLGVALPAFLVITAIAANYAAWRTQTWTARAFAGVRPAVVVLVAGAAWRLGTTALGSRASWATFAAASAALLALRLHPLTVVVIAACAALVRELFATSRQAGDPEEPEEPEDMREGVCGGEHPGAS
jgi:chromate transporter